jgi:hypothetical protein
VRTGRGETDVPYSIKDINENCLAEFRTHWQCLENHNQQLWNCRSEERRLNKCVFEKLVCMPWFALCFHADWRRIWRRRYQTHPRARLQSICEHATSLRHTRLCIYTGPTAQQNQLLPLQACNQRRCILNSSRLRMVTMRTTRPYDS